MERLWGEEPNYNGTKAIGDAVARSTRCGAFSLVGGGDTVAAVKSLSYKTALAMFHWR